MLSTANIEQRKIVKRDTLTSKYLEKKEAEKFILNKDIISSEIKAKLINILSMKNNVH